MCKVSAVGKTSDCQPGCSRFNPQPGRGLNFGQPFARSSADREVKPMVYSLMKCYVRGLERTHTFLKKSRVIPVLVRATWESTPYGCRYFTQGPHSQILMMRGEGEGVRQRFIFYTQKDHNFRICLPQKITTFFSIPKKIPQSFFCNPKKSLCFFLRPKKIPASFIDPKKSLWAKISVLKYPGAPGTLYPQ